MDRLNLSHLSDLVSADMVTEDSLGNTRIPELPSDYFSEQEVVNELNKLNAVINIIESEIERVKRKPYVISKSGKRWENSPYWESNIGNVLISDLGDDHLSRIPRHLYNNRVVNNADDLPPNIVDEIAKRGFKLLNNCIVLRR